MLIKILNNHIANIVNTIPRYAMSFLINSTEKQKFRANNRLVNSNNVSIFAT